MYAYVACMEDVLDLNAEAPNLVALFCFYESLIERSARRAGLSRPSLDRSSASTTRTWRYGMFNRFVFLDDEWSMAQGISNGADLSD